MALNSQLPSKKFKNTNKKVSIVIPSLGVKNLTPEMDLKFTWFVQLATELDGHGIETVVYNENYSIIDYLELLHSSLVIIDVDAPHAMKGYALADALQREGVNCMIHTASSIDLIRESLEVCSRVTDTSDNQKLKSFAIEILKGEMIADENFFTDFSLIAKSREFIRKTESVFSQTIPDFFLVHSWDEHHALKRPRIPVVFWENRPVSSILEEIKIYRNEKVQFVFSGPDLMKNVDLMKSFLESISSMREISHSNWSATIPPSFASDDELASLMKRTGCSGIDFEFRSPDDINFSGNATGYNPGDLMKNIKNINSRNINVKGIFTCGFESETMDSLRQLLEFALESGVNDAEFNLHTALPGSQEYKSLELDGKITVSNWSLYDGKHVTLTSTSVSPWELQAFLSMAERKFYTPKRLMSNMLRGHFLVAAEMFTHRNSGLNMSKINSLFKAALRISRKNPSVPFRFDLKPAFTDIYRHVKIASGILGLAQMAN
ncbi:MAG: radical SAM protein [Deltaproteobacteria bacterium]|nr:radical SAM protein [Deltaproteobacteria bacterium]